MHIYKYLILVLIVLATGCDQGHDHGHDHADEHEHEAKEGQEHHEEENQVRFTKRQFEVLDMKIGKLTLRNMASGVQANGTLEVPPQNEAAVTAIMGGNVTVIEVIEGDEVRKGQVLAYLAHPSFTEMQAEYLKVFNEWVYLKKDFDRQKKLYENEVSSGKSFQKISADLQVSQAAVKSHEAQLRQYGLNPDRVQKGEFYNKIPVRSPISGTVSAVNVRTGQYVQPDMEMFEIVNTEHIHADLMVFEKDVHKVSKGQSVRFQVESIPGKELTATIYSVGKQFEQDPKAVHVHAEITNKSGTLIPGMYIQGQILTDSVTAQALPQEAIIKDGNKFYAFKASKDKDDTWVFEPVEVLPRTSVGDWTAIELMEDSGKEILWALNNAYYIQGELKKEEAGHSH